MAFYNNHDNGEVDLSHEIPQLLSDSCMSNKHADVTFIVGSTKIPAHKTILLLRSSYFESLFGGGFAEAKKDEVRMNVPLNAFKAILKYIYTGYLSLAGLESHQIIEIYDLAEQYDFDALKTAILDFLTSNLTLDNCTSILNAAHLYSLEDLQISCMEFMDCHSIELLGHDTFKTLPTKSLYALLMRDTFYAPEIDIFKAILNWSTNKSTADIKEALSSVRWQELSMFDYLNVVEPSKILNPTQLAAMMNVDRETHRTGVRIPCHNSYSKHGVDENFATIEYGAKTISGTNPSNILNGDFTNRKNYTSHNIGNDLIKSRTRDPGLDCIIIDLGNIRFINNINFLLLDYGSYSYSYHVDISVDGKEYIRFFDHTKYYYRSWQYLYFQSRPVQFIKLVGTRMVTNIFRMSCFSVVGLQAMYKTRNLPELVDGVIKPTENISKVEYGAYVQGGGGNNMLNENPDEFTCHEKDRHILLQLNQPYYIGSLRMLLGHYMNHSNKYSFVIETSRDNETWNIAVDKRNEYLSGWQEFDFEPRPAIFIKVTGTQSDINFICTYFECPRNPQKPKLKCPKKPNLKRPRQ